MVDDELRDPVPRTPRDEVRRRLIAAASRVFEARGYADSRLEDIARAAGFTKGAVYSNFGSKQELFGAVLGAGSEDELSAVRSGTAGADDPSSAADEAARLVARRIVDESARGQLGLEFAAQAARDERIRSVLAALRREQRAAAARSVAEVAERTGARPAVDPEVAALILHCLSNGLSNDHLVDPESVGPEQVQQALATAIRLLLGPTPSD
ncbi:TetR/AcrR family transcriptional regulator [Streptomyces sp. RFCAC02]|uniref:TetR/AcrR family transcriptional regulator n=1 Tax=Streptomyces sp. RFCAC02 TaxID=2499143 RepID=UPI0010202052|nr:TetR/AcrR family transcriptional regulator [Streptomyces sp. RFCAC02]